MLRMNSRRLRRFAACLLGGFTLALGLTHCSSRWVDAVTGGPLPTPSSGQRDPSVRDSEFGGASQRIGLTADGREGRYFR